MAIQSLSPGAQAKRTLCTALCGLPAAACMRFPRNLKSWWPCVKRQNFLLVAIQARCISPQRSARRSLLFLGPRAAIETGRSGVKTLSSRGGFQDRKSVVEGERGVFGGGRIGRG